MVSNHRYTFCCDTVKAALAPLSYFFCISTFVTYNDNSRKLTCCIVCKKDFSITSEVGGVLPVAQCVKIRNDLLMKQC